MATSIERWQVVNQFPALVRLFGQIAEHAGVRVLDTGEEFTCHIRPDRVDFEPKVNPGKVDFIIDLQRYQVDRLADVASTGTMTEIELYRIIRAMFTPATIATLKSPLVSNPALRILSGVEDLIHVRLLSPSPEEEDAVHTVLFANWQWLAIPGLWGRPARIFELTVADALAYHRKVVAAARSNRLVDWLAFTRWYRTWRRGVSRRR